MLRALHSPSPSQALLILPCCFQSGINSIKPLQWRGKHPFFFPQQPLGYHRLFLAVCSAVMAGGGELQGSPAFPAGPAPCPSQPRNLVVPAAGDVLSPSPNLWLWDCLSQGCSPHFAASRDIFPHFLTFLTPPHPQPTRRCLVQMSRAEQR